jgi:DNA ligase-1
LQKKLFAAAREDELLYLIRVAEGGLRIGAVITTVLSALAKAFVLHHLYCEGVAPERHWEACSFERVLKATEAVRGAKPGPFVLEEPLRADASPAARSACIARRLPSYLARATAKLRRAYVELPSFHDILPVLLASSTNIYDLHNHIRLTAGVPIKPQLGRAVTSVMQVLKLFRGMAFTIECKYDGLRAQIHRLSNGTYRIFSRHLMDQGNRWDDLVPLIEAAIVRPDDTHTFIIDAEIVAIQHMAQAAASGSSSAAAAAASSAPASADCSTDDPTPSAAPSPSFRILPFQQLATRKRKGDSSNAPLTAEKRVEVSCMVYAFDFLSLNGESLLLRSLPERRSLMAATFAERSGEFQFVEHCDISAASASNIVIEELDEEEENEAKIKPRAKAKSSAKAKPTSLKGAIAAAAVAADAADEQGSDDDEGSDVEEIDGAGAGSATRADADDELVLLQPPAEAKTDESAVAASASSSLSSDAVAAAPSASEQIAEFMRTVAIPRGEGIMAKSLSSHSTYEPDVRTDQWCKLKKDYMGGMGVADSIDVVIIGAWHGNGRKAGWLSPFLAAVYNPDNDEYESFAKIMTGFTDAVYKQFTEECLELAVPTPPRYYRVSESLRPTIWFKPKKVWEIRGADLTISPVHAAARGLVHESRVRVKHNDQCRRVRIVLSLLSLRAHYSALTLSLPAFCPPFHRFCQGISLRFPRFIREREDKSIEQCTTSDEVRRADSSCRVHAAAVLTWFVRGLDAVA